MSHARRPPETRIATECHSVPLRMLHRVVNGVYDAALRPFGLRIAQVNILAAIAQMADEASAARVGKYLRIEKSTLSRDLERMLAQKWIESAGDGRFRVLRLTGKGRRMLERALPSWERAQREVQTLIGKESLGAIAAAADRIRARLHNKR